MKDIVVMVSSLKNHRLEIGILLALSGTQISLVMKELFSVSLDLTNVIFLLSIVLIPDYSKILSSRFPLHGKQMGITLGYNIYVAALALLTGASMWASGTGIIYTLYTVVFILALMTNTRDIDGEYLVSITWGTMGVFSVLLFYLVTDGFRNFGGTIQYLSSGADRLSLSVIAFYYLCAMLLYHPQKTILKILKVLVAVVAFYDVMVCSRRGLMVALIVIFVYHLWQNASLHFSLRTVFKVIGTAVLVVFVLWVASNLIPGFSNLISSYTDRLVLGVNTYFGNTSGGTDAAAINRNINISNFAELFSSGTMLQLLFGHGYAYFWMDVPYLEAFIDLGIFGGVWYLIIQLFMPIRCLLRKTENVAIRFSQYFAIIAITYNLYSGVPYGHYKFVPVAILYYVMYAIEKRRNVITLHGGVVDSNR